MPYTAPANAAVPSAFLHANNGRISIASGGGIKTDFLVTGADFSWDCDSEDISHSASAGWRNKQPGQQGFSGTLEFVYDLTNMPLLDPHNMKPGTYVQLELNLNAQSTANVITTLNTQLYAGRALIKSFKMAGVGPSKGSQRVVCDWESDGIWTIPTS